MDSEHIGTNRRQGPKTACLLRRTEDRAKTVSFETPSIVFTNLDLEWPISIAGKLKRMLVAVGALRPSW